MSEEKVEENQIEPSPEPSPEPEEPTKITSKEKPKEKDPKKVAQGNRLGKISQKAKEKKMREKIESENRIDFSVNYNALLYFGISSVVFAGFYLYLSRKNANTENLVKFSPVKKEPATTKNNATKPVSLFD